VKGVFLTDRGGTIWVVDSLLGHLSIGHREGALQARLEHQTRLFHSIEELRAAIPPTYWPMALLLGYCDIEDAVSLIREAPLGEIPVLITDSHRLWPTDELPSYVHLGDGDVYGSLDMFVHRVLGRRR